MLFKNFQAILVAVLVLVMASPVFAQENSAELPEGVVPLTWQPTPEHLAIQTAEARELYDRIKNGDYPSMKELKKSPVVAQLDALSEYYVKIYGNTVEIDTPERWELREKILQEFLSTGSARKVSVTNGRAKYVFDGPLKKEYQMILVLGLPAVGKSIAYVNPNSEKLGAFILDCDDIKKMLPEYKESYGGASEAVHEESFEVLKKAMETFLTGKMQGTNILLPLVADNFDDLMNDFVKPFEAAGYNVRAVYIDAPENVSFANNINRQLASGRMFDSVFALSYGKKPKKVYNKLKNMKNSKGEKYGISEIKYKFQKQLS